MLFLTYEFNRAETSITLSAWGFAEILPKICNLTIQMNADM